MYSLILSSVFTKGRSLVTFSRLYPFWTPPHLWGATIQLEIWPHISIKVSSGIADSFPPPKDYIVQVLLKKHWNFWTSIYLWQNWRYWYFSSHWVEVVSIWYRDIDVLAALLILKSTFEKLLISCFQAEFKWSQTDPFLYVFKWKTYQNFEDNFTAFNNIFSWYEIHNIIFMLNFFLCTV